MSKGRKKDLKPRERREGKEPRGRNKGKGLVWKILLLIGVIVLIWVLADSVFKSQSPQEPPEEYIPPEWHRLGLGCEDVVLQETEAISNPTEDNRYRNITVPVKVSKEYSNVTIIFYEYYKNKTRSDNYTSYLDIDESTGKVALDTHDLNVTYTSINTTDIYYDIICKE